MQKEKFTKEEREILKLFQTAENRSAEEMYAQFVTEKSDVRLFFINENQAYTDGKNIIVDPADNHKFSDKKALQQVEQYVGIPPEFSQNMWNALAFVTHAQTLHESLHILYTKFPSYLTDIKRFDTKPKQFAVRMIQNIIEDAFIENAGATLYDNMTFYLKCNRILDLTSHFKCEGTIERSYKNIVGKALKKAPQTVQPSVPQTAESQAQRKTPDPPEHILFMFLDYLALYANYAFIELDPPPEQIKEYFTKAKQCADEAVICGNARRRAELCSEIYEIIKDIIPAGEKISDDKTLSALIGSGEKTHKGSYFEDQGNSSEPKEIIITKKLFERGNGDGHNNKLTSREIQELNLFIQQQHDAHDKATVVITLVPVVETIDASQLDLSGIHKGIKIHQVKPATDRKLESAYKKITDKYAVTINTWSKRFNTIISGDQEVEEDKLYFGTSISSARFSDLKKRYWKRNIMQKGIPELAVMIMIDGSGSMSGERQHAAIESCVILHEVLKKQNIEHCIADYLALYKKDDVVHNVLLDFQAKKMDCLSILTYEPDEGTRDGISMMWAEKYIAKKTTATNKLIIVISDGEPDHEADKAKPYHDYAAVKDSALSAKKIVQRGTRIVGVALDENRGDDSFETLKQIYPDSIKCTDLNKLTGQILQIIALGIE